MKRRYKLLLIIILGTIVTIIINSIRLTTKTNVVALGDGVCLGMTPYNVAGTSFNDYFKEKLENNNDLESYNTEFSIAELTVHELNEYFEDNVYGKNTRKPIKQIIAASNIIVISVGEDEIAYKTKNQALTTEIIDNYLDEMSILLSSIREFYHEKIIIIGLYPAYNFKQKDVIEVNTNLRNICGKYNANFIDILALSLNRNYYLEEKSYYMNYLAHKEISKLIYDMYKNGKIAT